jgi:hypothetical protein
MGLCPGVRGIPTRIPTQRIIRPFAIKMTRPEKVGLKLILPERMTMIKMIKIIKL